eukprot:1158267-Pelagomonas_calceolata.AAC.6
MPARAFVSAPRKFGQHRAPLPMELEVKQLNTVHSFRQQTECFHPTTSTHKAASSLRMTIKS